MTNKEKRKDAINHIKRIMSLHGENWDKELFANMEKSIVFPSADITKKKKRKNNK